MQCKIYHLIFLVFTSLLCFL